MTGLFIANYYEKKNTLNQRADTKSSERLHAKSWPIRRTRGGWMTFVRRWRL